MLKKIKSFIKYFFDKKHRFYIKEIKGKFNNMNDEDYLKMKFENVFGKSLDLNYPITFNEKIQWLKLYNRKPEFTMMVDKYKVREYIEKKIGAEYLIPLIGVWDNPDEIDFNLLPKKFVLKCNHNSGKGMYICKDKSRINIKRVKKELREGLEENYYLTGREWPYKNVARKIMCEQFMEDSKLKDLPDFKIHCFNGVPRVILVCKDRFTSYGMSEDFFDINWNHLDIKRPNCKNAINKIEKPQNLKKMLELSMILSKNIPFLRVDFYEINGRVYFGEITFYPASGFTPFIPEEWDKKFGDWIDISQIKK